MSAYELAQLNIAVMIMRRRKEWFERMPEAFMVLWWVPGGHRPDVAEASTKLDLLRAKGPTADAFTLRHPFPAPDASSDIQQAGGAHR